MIRLRKLKLDQETSCFGNGTLIEKFIFHFLFIHLRIIRFLCDDSAPILGIELKIINKTVSLYDKQVVAVLYITSIASEKQVQSST